VSSLGARPWLPGLRLPRSPRESWLLVGRPHRHCRRPIEHHYGHIRTLEPFNRNSVENDQRRSGGGQVVHRVEPGQRSIRLEVRVTGPVVRLEAASDGPHSAKQLIRAPRIGSLSPRWRALGAHTGRLEAGAYAPPGHFGRRRLRAVIGPVGRMPAGLALERVPSSPGCRPGRARFGSTRKVCRALSAVGVPQWGWSGSSTTNLPGRSWRVRLRR
jgi:hypothetical protein